MAAQTIQGNPCRSGHSGLRDRFGKCIECKNARNAEYRARRDSGRQTSFVQGIPKEFAEQHEKELKARNKRLAAVRAERTARQKACAYGVRV